MSHYDLTKEERDEIINHFSEQYQNIPKFLIDVAFNFDCSHDGKIPKDFLPNGGKRITNSQRRALKREGKDVPENVVPLNPDMVLERLNRQWGKLHKSGDKGTIEVEKGAFTYNQFLEDGTINPEWLKLKENMDNPKSYVKGFEAPEKAETTEFNTEEEANKYIENLKKSENAIEPIKINTIKEF